MVMFSLWVWEWNIRDRKVTSVSSQAKPFIEKAAYCDLKRNCVTVTVTTLEYRGPEKVLGGIWMQRPMRRGRTM